MECGPLPLSQSASFAALADPIRAWIESQGWVSLTCVQERGIPAILSGEQDVLLCAPTASGKTEAAFLPILSRQLSDPVPGLFALYISPLKALIDDLYRRLRPLAESLGIEVHRRHGDVPAMERARYERRPRGILLTTPESLEGMLLGRQITPFQSLRAVVVDEWHAFVGSERGVQVRFQMARLEAIAGRTVRRVGLSATIGEPGRAAMLLRPAKAAQFVNGAANDTSEFVLEIHAFCGDGAEEDLVRDLFDTLRGGDHLAFDCTRGGVEITCDRLARLSEEAGVRNEFVPHHGSLSKEVRQDAEGRLRGDMPTTIVCTSTLELGIDIGNVQSVAQLGPPPTVASLRQRLGRSGRRGEPSVLRLFVAEETSDPPTTLDEWLHLGLLQSIAAVELLREGWYEPVDDSAPHYSTLTQQILSVLRERGSVCAADLESLLKGASVHSARLDDLTAALIERDLLAESADGRLVLGHSGLALTSDPRFVVAFSTSDEFRVFAENRPLGRIPAESLPDQGAPLIFAGRRWRVESIEHRTKTVRLVEGPDGDVVQFAGGVPRVHRVVRERMLALLTAKAVPDYLDGTAARLLKEARSRYRLVRERAVAGIRTPLFHWSGDREAWTLATMLGQVGCYAWAEGPAVISPMEAGPFIDTLSLLASSPPPDAERLAESIRFGESNPFDWLLPKPLLLHEFACTRFDVEGALQIVRTVLTPH